MSDEIGIFELPDVPQGDEWGGMTLRYEGTDLVMLLRAQVVLKSVTNGLVVALDSAGESPGVVLTRDTAADWLITVGPLQPCPFTLGPVTVSVKTWTNELAPRTYVKGSFNVTDDE